MLGQVNAQKTIHRELIAALEPGGKFQLDWQETEEQIDKSQILFQADLYKRFLENAESALLFLGFSEQLISISESLDYLRLVAGQFVRNLSRDPDVEMLREKTVVEIEYEDIERILRSCPFLFGSEHLDQNWLKNVWDGLNYAFAREIKKFAGSVAQFFAFYSSGALVVGRVFFHLVESKRDKYPFAFLATYAAEVSKSGKSKHLSLKNALIEYGANSNKLLELLSTGNKAAENSAFIAEIMESGEIFHPLGLTVPEAYTFLREIPVYEEAGILCRIPNWWKHKSNSFKISVSIGNKPPAHLNFDALVDFNTELFLGGERITAGLLCANM